MQHTKLHLSKIAILSRLLKESSLTLDEALVLLAVEDADTESVSHEPVIKPPSLVYFSQNNHVPYDGTTTTTTYSAWGEINNK